MQQQHSPPSNIHIMTNDPATRAALQQQQLQQAAGMIPTSNISMQSPSSAAAATVGSNMRIINRNYLQIQPGVNKSSTSTLTQQQQQQAAAMYGMNSQLDPKQTRTISNSLKSLLMPRSTSRQQQQMIAKKREKSYDSPSVLMQSSSHHPFDTQSGKHFINSFLYSHLFLRSRFTI